MIVGVVREREAVVQLSIQGFDGRQCQIAAVIDTGYTGSITLPPEMIADLDLPWQGTARGTLANGHECLFDVFQVAVLWDGTLRRVLADEVDATPLVGMALLQGYELNMQITNDGIVQINAL